MITTIPGIIKRFISLGLIILALIGILMSYFFYVSRTAQKTSDPIQVSKITDLNVSNIILVDNSFFSFDTGTHTITAYSDAGPKDVIIPATIGGIDVTSIGDDAFFKKQLTSIIIPSSVTKIGNGAFNGNNLPDAQAFIYDRNIDGSMNNKIILSYGGINKVPTIPSNVVSIADYAFASNQIKSIIIPSSITSIGNGAFFNNQLTNISIPSSITSIGNWVFGSNQLTNISIPSSITSIGNYAFNSNQLTNISIPSSVTSIGESAFSSNRLTNISIPSSITSIGDGAFFQNGSSGNSLYMTGFISGGGGVWNIIGRSWMKQY